MHEELKKPYNPEATEAEVYKKWEDSGFFNPDNLPGDRKEFFSIVLPPPNVTGTLHMGSALMLAIEDILVRFARMQGKKVLWIPGTDSAAIATQAKVEKEIQKKEGKNRYDLGREELLKRISEFAEESKSTILNQIRNLGASVDWTRYAYTMDEKRYKAVLTAFVNMYEAGLIYRANRIVNWDPKGQTVISDDEIEHEEREATFYTFKYWKDFPIAIATTRLETKVGDTAVAVHPEDPRYQKFIGNEYEGEFAGAKLKIKVVSDKNVEKDFGTGALGVTPAHSHMDWDIAEANGLAKIQVIDEKARMTENAGSLVSGLKTIEAREKIVEWVKNNGLLEKEEKITQNVSVAERTGGVIEPLPKLQWFIDVNKPIKNRGERTLKELMQEPVKSGDIKILPERFERVYYNWIDNLRPWCISRQIWFGHRIPIWYRDDQVHCGIEAPDRDGWKQDEDVLDTWFSSALWTFSTLGWPENTPDLKNFHPTTIIETGYDIIFFWVARMILMSQFHLGEIPFNTVYLHGLVRDAQGRKISKSLGNNVDPVEMVKKFGADAVRMSLIVGSAPGNDSRISEDKIKAYKHFANKIWNATRFVLENTLDIRESDIETKNLSETDSETFSEFKKNCVDITEDMENYRFYLAAEKIYQYFWHTFADVIIEECKKRIQEEKEAKSAKILLRMLLDEQIKILHPFMPFVTEKIWSLLPNRKNLLIIEAWPGSQK
ncbi:MAG TPA: valine--tRNA ligase [Candidatus Paceibacterota bacterium]